MTEFPDDEFYSIVFPHLKRQGEEGGGEDGATSVAIGAAALLTLSNLF